MKIFSLLALLVSFHAQAASWLEIQLNHTNFQYAEGEKATFFLRQTATPTSPAFRLKTTLEYVNHGAPAELALTNGVGIYQSPNLPLGSQNFRVITRLLSVPSGTYDQVLEDRVFILTVLPNP